MAQLLILAEQSEQQAELSSWVQCFNPAARLLLVCDSIAIQGRCRAARKAKARLDIMMPHCHHHDVRTTLTLDEDVAKQLRREVRKSGESFKATVNHYLRLGLRKPQPKETKPFEVHPKPMGLPPRLSYDKISELLDHLEGPYWR